MIGQALSRMRTRVERLRLSGERGAVLALVAVLLVVVMSAAALAVDLASLDRQGQTLQGAADAAALGSVATWVSTEDPDAATLVARDLVRANNLDPSLLAITFPTANDVRVTLRDDAPDVFLGAAIGLGASLSRNATAHFSTCDLGCSTEVDLPQPVAPAHVGAGGMKPILVGTNVYALEPASGYMSCFDTDANEWCFDPAPAFPVSDIAMPYLAHAEVVGTKIWYLGQRPQSLDLFCWDTIADEPCFNSIKISDLENETADGSLTYAARGGGLTRVGNRLFMFTDDHRVHCVDVASFAACAEYGAGVKASTFAPFDASHGVTGSGTDAVFDEDSAQLFWTLPLLRNTSSEPHYSIFGQILNCWDVNANDTCDSFQTSIMAEAKINAGRLFMYRDADGATTNVCMLNLDAVLCRNKTGWPVPGSDAAEAAMSQISSSMAGFGTTPRIGTVEYNEATNRLFIPSPTPESTILCFDFTTQSGCGSTMVSTNGFLAMPLGFTSVDDCVYARGSAGYLWGFSASDLTKECLTLSFDHQLYPCACNGSTKFPSPKFQLEAELFDTFKVAVVDQDGVVLKNVDLLTEPNLVVDLSDARDEAYLVLEVEYEAKNVEAFEGETAPAFSIDFSSLPILVD